MALTSTLSTGLSGLNVNQAWLNVIGNNIANVNTPAFKESQVLFSPQFYVTDQAGSAPDTTSGGVNPSQHGLGAQVASITKDFTPGAINSTGVDTDLAISGNGFFVVNSTTGQQFTRDGAFQINSNNNLVTGSGAFVQGYGADSDGHVIKGALQNLTIPVGQQTVAKPTSNVFLQGNLNSNGDVAAGATILNSQAFGTVGGTAPAASTNLVDLRSTDPTPVPLFSVGDVLTLAGTKGSRQLASSTLAISPTTTVTDLQNFVNQGLGIDTTVSEAGNPPPGATLQTTGNTAQFTIIGNSGTENALTLGSSGISDSGTGTNPLTMTSGSDGAFKDDPVGESTHTTVTAYDSLGTPLSVDVTAVMESKSNTSSTWRFYATSAQNAGGGGPVVGDGTITFDNNGRLLSTTGSTISINRVGTGATTPLTVNLNFSSVTGLASTTSNLVMTNQDGEAIGSLTSFSVGTDGTINGSFSNGLTKSLGQVVVANFNNPQGLVDQGGNMFTVGANSGSATITPPGEVGTGTIQAGALEQSNVDISREFTNLIIASTGFNASSHVISTSNQLLTDLLNSQR